MYDKALMLQKILVDRATGGHLDEAEYIKLRKELMDDPNPDNS